MCSSLFHILKTNRPTSLDSWLPTSCVPSSCLLERRAYQLSPLPHLAFTVHPTTFCSLAALHRWPQALQIQNALNWILSFPFFDLTLFFLLYSLTQWLLLTFIQLSKQETWESTLMLLTHIPTSNLLPSEPYTFYFLVSPQFVPFSSSRLLSLVQATVLTWVITTASLIFLFLVMPTFNPLSLYLLEWSP